MVYHSRAHRSHTSRPVRPARPIRIQSTGSFHADAPIPSITHQLRPAPDSLCRLSSQSQRYRYHTFPTDAPKTPPDAPQDPADMFPNPGRQPGGSGDGSGSSSSSTLITRVSDAAQVSVKTWLGRDSRQGTSHGRRQPGTASSSEGSDSEDETPLPWKQLGLLALLSLAEQTALNSIGPYLPIMVEATLPDMVEGRTGLYVGLLASAFALAQLATNLLWGCLSDTVGRKPVMLAGTTMLAACFCAFGFCETYPQLMMVHVLMGLLNGNAALVPTCLGEVTDRSNQSRAFTWLPLMYSIGAITGPALGGLLVGYGAMRPHPFLAPNMASAALLLASVVALGIGFEETLDTADTAAVERAFARIKSLMKQFGCPCFGACKPRHGRPGSWSSRWPRKDNGTRRVMDTDDQDALSFDAAAEEEAPLLNENTGHDHAAHDGGSPDYGSDNDMMKRPSGGAKSVFRQLANRTTVAVLLSYLVFQLANVSFSSLYPIFASAEPPAGRGLDPETIGLSLSSAGLITILFQAFAYQRTRDRLGSLGTYRWALVGLAVSMALMPWVGKPGESGSGRGRSVTTHLYLELGLVLVLRGVCAVGGLSSVMLLITNSAPSHQVLGTLMAVAQTLAATGRSVGPLVSGGLFTLSTRVQPHGEMLTWWLFAGIALAGCLSTLLIRGQGLESGRWESHDHVEEGHQDEAGHRP